MIYGLTPFFNELDVLEIRLAELDRVIDHHIIAEAPVTHSGEPKPLHLRDHWERFEPWHEKITYLVVDDMPVGEAFRTQPPVLAEACDSDHWVREKHQREALSRGLPELDEDDVLFLSDLDEIPFPAAVESCAKAARAGLLVVPLLAMHVYRIRWRWHDSTIPIARFFSPAMLAQHGGNLEKMRLVRSGTQIGPKTAPALGWHLAYMGDIPTKLRALAHRELDTPRARSNVRRGVTEGYDIFDREHREAYLCPDEQMPPYVLANRDRFAHIL